MRKFIIKGIYLRSREAIIIFLVIMISTSVYVVYQNFLPKSEAVNGYQSEIDHNVATSSFDFDEPKTFEEMMSDLQSVGCDTIITFTGGMSGNIFSPYCYGLSYNDALKLARKANFVGVTEDQSIGFIFYLDGAWWIWLKSSQQYAQFEKIEVTSAYATDSTAIWDVTLNLKNTGTTAATITDVLINGKSYVDFGSGNIQVFTGSNGGTKLSSNGYQILSGTSGKVTVEIKKIPAGTPTPYKWSPGTTIEVSLHTGAGNTYMKMITLP